MIRHCVFINFNDQVSPVERQTLFDEVKALRVHLAGIIAMHFGVNVSPETGMDKEFSQGFIIDFETSEHRDAYLIDEDHKKLGAKLVQAAKKGVDGILVFDLAIEL